MVGARAVERFELFKVPVKVDLRHPPGPGQVTPLAMEDTAYAADNAYANSLPALLPSPTDAPKRADLLSLKLRLAALLPPDEGRLYWLALVDFLTGKINRDELGAVITRVLGVKGEAGQSLISPSPARAC